MAPLGAIAGSAYEIVGPLVGRALRAFLTTLLGMAALTVVMAGAAFFTSRGAAGADAPWLRWAVPVLVALVAGAVLAVLLASKRAIAMALVEGLGRFRLAERLVRSVFAKLGDGQLARGLERLPLADAEHRLRSAVQAMLGQRAEKGGFFATRIHDAALRQVERLTLAKFREANARTGGVDLALVRDELAQRGDELLRDAILDRATKLTYMVAAAYVAGVLVVAYTVREFF
ncbi:hypothetical protein LVJ94_29145 [Pendulispora rubella]|uniref:Uncharacterized protein n=1 Tax=Pendulispora rubella TaxID=2741070 RepID=A0ABZ2KTC4_9BACT